MLTCVRGYAAYPPSLRHIESAQNHGDRFLLQFGGVR